MKLFSSQQSGCVFCTVQKEMQDVRNFVVCRGESAFVILNLYPYTSGHLLVVANRHEASFEQLTPACRSEMMELATRCISVLRLVYKPDGFNLGSNVGAAAGAGIPGHVHLHVVPRWTGDSSFISVLGDTRILPEEVEESYQRIKKAWDANA
jgi:ATP adenylyltransferase